MAATVRSFPAVIYGAKPRPPYGIEPGVRWSARSFDDEGLWTFTTFEGWAVIAQTTTDDPEVAALLSAHLETVYGPGVEDPNGVR